MPGINTLLFDLGSTLIYFDGEWPEVLQEANHALLQSLQRAGLPLDGSFQSEFAARLQEYYTQRDTEFIEYTTLYLLRTLLAERGHPQVPESILRRAIDAMYAVSQAHWHPEADAAPTLHALRARGYRLGMISNAGDDADVQHLIDRAGLRPYFQVILSSAAQGIRKPNPRIFTTALAALKSTPGQAAMVGDTLGADILGARNAGIYAVWITRRADSPANRAHADTIRPDATIAALSELPGLLDRLV
jgi:HAD superfamily hydrolase (TIGR01549 family)